MSTEIPWKDVLLLKYVCLREKIHNINVSVLTRSVFPWTRIFFLSGETGEWMKSKTTLCLMFLIFVKHLKTVNISFCNSIQRTFLWKKAYFNVNRGSEDKFHGYWVYLTVVYFGLYQTSPAKICLFKVNIKNTRKGAKYVQS